MNETYSLVTYTKEKITHAEGGDLANLLGRVEDGDKVWLTINGYSATDREAMAQLFSFFDIDPSLADVLVDETRRVFRDETRQYLFADYAIPYIDHAADAYLYISGVR
jgi:hypothetical protein